MKAQTHTILKSARFWFINYIFLSSALSHALISVGENLDIFVTADVGSRYQTNVFLAPTNKQEDGNLVVSPGFEARYGRNGRAGVDVAFYEDIYFYNKFTGLNTQNANLFLNGFYEGNKISFNSSFSFVQTAQNTANVLLPNIGAEQFANLLQHALVSQNNWAADIHAKYDASVKTYLEGGFEFVATQYTKTFKDIYNDKYVYAIPLNAYYRYTETIDIGVGYRLSYTDVSGAFPLGATDIYKPADRCENAVYLTMVGSPTAKLKMNIFAGIANQQLEKTASTSAAISSRDTTTFAFNGEALWLTTKKLNFVLSCERDFAVGANGQDIINLGATVGARYAYSEKLNLESNIQWVNSNYQTQVKDNALTESFVDNFNKRVDNTVNAKMGIKWIPYEEIYLKAAYTYQYNQSTKAYARYANNMFELEAGVRF